MLLDNNASITLVVAAGALLLFQVFLFARKTSRSSSLPPGPATVPFLGNLHQIPPKKGFLKFQEWSKIYGPILGLKVGPSNLIILNKAEAVRDLFDKKGAIYSSRPPNHIGEEVITGHGLHLLLTPYGPRWRLTRRAYQAILSITAVTSLQPLQDAEAKVTMKQLIQTPELYYDHIRRYSTAVVLSSVYGIRGPYFNHPNIQQLYHVQDQFTAILETGATPPVDIFPILKYLPEFLSPWRKWALKIRTEQRQLYYELLQGVKDRLEKGISRNCFMDELIKDTNRSKFELNDETIAYIGGVFMEGGSDTTASTLLSFLMAMAKYPEVLRKAQREVDALCGTKRSPNFEDIAQLSYIDNCVTEVLRWRPVAAGGIPHTLIEDDTYMNYTFPKGSTFLANTWAIHHDEEFYDNPSEFIPERFEKNELGFRDDVKAVKGIRKIYAFGAGRRICPGQHLAEKSLLINVAKLVWTFCITPGRDSISGRQLSNDEINDSIATEWTDGFLTAPKKFPLTLKVRSPEHEAVIMRECKEAKNIFNEYGDGQL